MKTFRLLPFCLCLLLCTCSAPSSRLTIFFTGDLLLDRGVRTQINLRGIEALFAKVKPLFNSADYVVANLECPVTDTRSPIQKKYIFRAEPSYLPAVRNAGITHLVMANNHSNDQGRAEVATTATHLRRNGLVPVGYGENQQQACSPTLISKNGQAVAVFASVCVPLENWMYLENAPSPCQASPEQLAQRIFAYRTANPPHAIVVVLHWGTEFQQRPTRRQQQQATALIDAGADAVIGHHPHVIQTIDFYKGKPIFYSVGNFVFDQQKPLTKQCLAVALTFGAGKMPGVAAHPLSIVNCAPVPMQGREVEECKKMVEGLSKGVRWKSGAEVEAVE